MNVINNAHTTMFMPHLQPSEKKISMIKNENILIYYTISFTFK